MEILQFKLLGDNTLMKDEKVNTIIYVHERNYIGTESMVHRGERGQIFKTQQKEGLLRLVIKGQEPIYLDISNPGAYPAIYLEDSQTTIQDYVEFKDSTVRIQTLLKI